MQCRLLHSKCRGVAQALPDSGLPNLSKKSQKLFQQQRELWWSRFTNICEFSKKIKPPFAYRVATDGASVSVLFERSTAATANAQADADLQTRNNPATAAIPDKSWVRGPILPIAAPQLSQWRIVGIDPGAKAVFTGVVHSAVAEQMLSDPCPVRYRSQLYEQLNRSQC